MDITVGEVSFMGYAYFFEFLHGGIPFPPQCMV